MRPNDARKGKIDWILDALASQIGILIIIGFLLSVCFGVSKYVQVFVAQLEKDHAVFRDRQTRNGYVAMSDIQRLILVVQNALEEGRMTSELEAQFIDAADIMYVRANNFKRVMKQEDASITSGEQSITSLHRVVEIADNAIENGFPDLRALLKALLNENAEARRHLVQFLDDMRRQAEEVLDKQSTAVRKQQFIVSINLVGLALVGTIALILFRLEVMGRKVRDKAQKDVEFLAFFDPLTLLPNRTQFQNLLNEELRRAQPLALVYADLDDFKLINDTHGHAAGDEVLCHISRILKSVSEGLNGFSARLAGDEFAMLIPDDNISLLRSLCEDVISLSTEPYWFEGEFLIVTVSLGVATSTQLNSSGRANVDMLSRAADFALYTSKEAGRKSYTVYDHVIEQRYWERRGLIEELPRAIANGDLLVHFQPKVSLSTRAVYGFEALVRWKRNGQLVSPIEFIAIAEESGHILDIDHYVLKEATTIISKINKTHGTCLSISVNLSALHFNSDRISQWVEQALWNSGLSHELLTLEITESTELRDWGNASKIINELKNLGCRIAIDDFGTGFSSLAYLRMMKAHELKIDRSLIFELEESEKARLMFASVLEIARNLDLSVTIEGIETNGQANISYEMGAENAQGFLFGRSLPPDEAMDALSNTELSDGIGSVAQIL